jgi:hypothetical protein
LHERSHDLSDAILVKASWLHIVDIFLIVFASLLFAGLFSDSAIPSITIVDTESFDGGMGEFRRALGLSLAADVARAI